MTLRLPSMTIRGGAVTEYVLDAHALVWMLEGNPGLGAGARAVLSDPKSVLLLPVTALAEACWVVSKGRTSLAEWRSVIQSVAADRRVQVIQLNMAIVERAMSLPVPLEMHDGQIVATALLVADQGRDVRLLTTDRSIVKSGLVSIVW
jgi:PIN domain nuclease of toxin-antitoxin system